MEELRRKLKQSMNYLNENIEMKPKLAVIFGTGLSEETLTHLENPKRVLYKSIPNLNETSIDYHEGAMIFTKMNKKDVLFMSGRIHYYEGYKTQEVVYPIHLLKEIGIENLVITSAVGGVRKDLKKGDLMLIKDHINLTSINPITGYDNSLGSRFLDCSNLYNNILTRKIEDVCIDKKIKIKKGTLFFLSGPTFETKAEFKAIKKLGGDAIAWSNILEALVAHYRGMNVASIVCITDSLNFSKKQDLDEIAKVSKKSSKSLYDIVEGLINKI